MTAEAMLRIHPVLYLYGAANKIGPRKRDFHEGRSFTVLEKLNGLPLTEVRSGPATDFDLRLHGSVMRSNSFGGKLERLLPSLSGDE